MASSSPILQILDKPSVYIVLSVFGGLFGVWYVHTKTKSMNGDVLASTLPLFPLASAAVFNFLLSMILLVYFALNQLFFSASPYESEHATIVDKLSNFFLFKIVLVGLVLEPDVIDTGLWIVWCATLAAVKALLQYGLIRLDTMAQSGWTIKSLFRPSMHLVFVVGYVFGSLSLWGSVIGEGKLALWMLLYFDLATISLDWIHSLALYGAHYLKAATIDRREVIIYDTEDMEEFSYSMELLTDVLTLVITLLHFLHVYTINGISLSLVDILLLLNIRSTGIQLIQKIRDAYILRMIRLSIDRIFPNFDKTSNKKVSPFTTANGAADTPANASVNAFNNATKNTSIKIGATETAPITTNASVSASLSATIAGAPTVSSSFSSFFGFLSSASSKSTAANTTASSTLPTVSLNHAKTDADFDNATVKCDRSCSGIHGADTHHAERIETQEDVEDDDDEGEEDFCSICLLELQTSIKSLPCGHRIHSKCLRTLIFKGSKFSFQNALAGINGHPHLNSPSHSPRRSPRPQSQSPRFADHQPAGNYPAGFTSPTGSTGAAYGSGNHEGIPGLTIPRRRTPGSPRAAMDAAAASVAAAGTTGTANRGYGNGTGQGNGHGHGHGGLAGLHPQARVGQTREGFRDSISALVRLFTVASPFTDHLREENSRSLVAKLMENVGCSSFKCPLCRCDINSITGELIVRTDIAASQPQPHSQALPVNRRRLSPRGQGASTSAAATTSTAASLRSTSTTSSTLWPEMFRLNMSTMIARDISTRSTTVNHSSRSAPGSGSALGSGFPNVLPQESESEEAELTVRTSNLSPRSQSQSQSQSSRLQLSPRSLYPRSFPALRHAAVALERTPSVNSTYAETSTSTSTSTVGAERHRSIWSRLFGRMTFSPVDDSASPTGDDNNSRRGRRAAANVTDLSSPATSTPSTSPVSQEAPAFPAASDIIISDRNNLTPRMTRSLGASTITTFHSTTDGTLYQQADHVLELFPSISRDLVIQDLQETHSIELTVNNLIEARGRFRLGEDNVVDNADTSANGYYGGGIFSGSSDGGRSGGSSSGGSNSNPSVQNQSDSNRYTAPPTSLGSGQAALGGQGGYSFTSRIFRRW